MNDVKNNDGNNELPTLNTGMNREGASTPPPGNTQPAPDKLPLLGIFAVIFGVIGVLTFSLPFVPLALLLGVIALFIGQVGWGLAAIVLGIIGIFTSPLLLAALGLGVVLAYFGLPVPM